MPDLALESGFKTGRGGSVRAVGPLPDGRLAMGLAPTEDRDGTTRALRDCGRDWDDLVLLGCVLGAEFGLEPPNRDWVAANCFL